MKPVGSYTICILVLACLSLLINPAQCGIEFKFWGEPNNPHLFLADNDAVITYYWDYGPQQLESYRISVGHSRTGQEIWNSTINLDDKFPGEHSPLNGTFGSPNLGKRTAAKDYYALLTTKPIGDTLAINYSEPFFVTPNPGYITIIKFHDKNENKIRESSEEGLGGNFVVTNDIGFYQMVPINGSDGTFTIPVDPGQYKITESAQSCWNPTNDVVQSILIGAGETKPVYFGNKPDTEAIITVYNDTNRNGKHDIGEPGVSGITFTISGQQGTPPQSSVSGPDGSAKFTGIPGISYTITATSPENMDLIGPNSIPLNPCDQKSVEFLVQSPPIFEIRGLVPANNDVIGSRDVLFAWKTPNVSSSSEVYLKPESSGAYKRYIGQDGIDHSIFVPNLTRNTWYNFNVKSEVGQRYKQSETRRFFISNGIIFVPRYYNFTVDRDLSQSRTVTVENTDVRAHKLHMNVSNPYNDIYLGFLGYSSADREVTLQPGEIKNIDLVIHAQDAKNESYQFVINLNSLDPDPIVDNALVDVNVIQPNYDFNITEVSTDPFTQVKNLKVTNLIDPITDLSIVPDENLRNKVIIQPTIYHSSLGRNESILFSVSPIWSNDTGPIRGNLIASAGSITKRYPIDFTCSEGNQIYPIELHNLTMYLNWNLNQCINVPDPITGTFFLPPGLKAGNVISAQISMELDPRSPKFQTERYNVWVDINNNVVGTIDNTIPSGRYGFEIDPTYFNYADAGSASNAYSIRDTMLTSYTTILSDVRLKLCVSELTLHICAGSKQDAERIAWTAPWIYRPSSNLNVRILKPENGSTLLTSRGESIRAEVKGTNGGEKNCDVFATFSNNDKPVWLIENDLAGNGIYESKWTPENLGVCKITVSATNCFGSGSNKTSVYVTQNTQRSTNSDLNIIKTLDPAVLNATEINIKNSTVIRYNITLCPKAGSLNEVKVIDTLPNYMDLKSVDPKANITFNHDGKAWSTTTVTWDLGELDTCRSVRLNASFSWKLPAEVNHLAGTPLPVSEVTYINPAGSIEKLEIPEGEIKIASVSPQKQPGFEMLLAVSGLLVVALVRRKR